MKGTLVTVHVIILLIPVFDRTVLLNYIMTLALELYLVAQATI